MSSLLQNDWDNSFFLNDKTIFVNFIFISYLNTN